MTFKLRDFQLGEADYADLGDLGSFLKAGKLSGNTIGDQTNEVAKWLIWIAEREESNFWTPAKKAVAAQLLVSASFFTKAIAKALRQNMNAKRSCGMIETLCGASAANLGYAKRALANPWAGEALRNIIKHGRSQWENSGLEHLGKLPSGTPKTLTVEIVPLPQPNKWVPAHNRPHLIVLPLDAGNKPAILNEISFRSLAAKLQVDGKLLCVAETRARLEEFNSTVEKTELQNRREDCKQTRLHRAFDLVLVFAPRPDMDEPPNRHWKIAKAFGWQLAQASRR